MRRKFPPTSKLHRTTQRFETKVEIFIACEGSVTEPAYFRDCVRHYGAGMVHLEIIPKTGVPLTVVRAAIETRKAMISDVRRGVRRKDPPFTVWAIFDRDEHNVAHAFELAKANGIRVAFSNPCFELWPLLHLNPEYGAQDGRYDLQRSLSALMPSYHHEQRPIVDFDLIKDSINDAAKAAKNLIAARDNEGSPMGCPVTSVGNLVERIIANGKFAYQLK
jgi:hypothetical protein